MDEQGLTNIQYVAPPTCVEMQRGVACRAVLGLDLSDELVEAGLVRDVSARELQDPLAAERVLQRFLADRTLAPNKGALAARSTPVRIHDAGCQGGVSRVGVSRRVGAERSGRTMGRCTERARGDGKSCSTQQSELVARPQAPTRFFRPPTALGRRGLEAGRAAQHAAQLRCRGAAGAHEMHTARRGGGPAEGGVRQEARWAGTLPSRGSPRAHAGGAE